MTISIKNTNHQKYFEYFASFSPVVFTQKEMR